MFLVALKLWGKQKTAIFISQKRKNIIGWISRVKTQYERTTQFHFYLSLFWMNMCFMWPVIFHIWASVNSIQFSLKWNSNFFLFILIFPSILYFWCVCVLQTCRARYEMMVFCAIQYANSLLIEILVSVELLSDNSPEETTRNAPSNKWARVKGKKRVLNAPFSIQFCCCLTIPWNFFGIL